jgi:hypothetical protein
MKEIFTLTFSPLAILERFVLLFLFTAVMIWFYTCIRTRFFKRAENPLKIAIKRALLEGTLLSIILLAIYFAFFVKIIGWRRFVWDQWHWSFSRNTYWMILPEFSMLILDSIFFWVQTNKVSNLIKNNKKS